MSILRYDDSLPEMVKILAQHLSAVDIKSGVVIRDITGRLSFYLPQRLPSAEFSDLDQALRTTLGAYGRSDRILAAVDDFGNSVLSDPTAYDTVVAGFNLRIVDRRLVGM